MNADEGDDDVIDTGGGADQVFGGAGDDDVSAGAGDDIVFGDHGRIDFDETMKKLQTFVEDTDGVDTISSADGLDIVFGGGAGDMINASGTDVAGDIILGDYGLAEFGVTGELVIVQSTNTELGGNDNITGGIGSNTVLGGFGEDVILAGGDDSPDTILGDSGQLLFYPSGQIQEVRTLGPSGTAQGGTASTIVLAQTETYADDVAERQNRENHRRHGRRSVPHNQRLRWGRRYGDRGCTMGYRARRHINLQNSGSWRK